VEIRHVENPRSRKDIGFWTWDVVVDSDICNFKDFVDGIVGKYPSSHHEHVNLFYYEHASKTYLEVKSDQDLLAMFTKHVDNKTVSMSIAYTLPTDQPYPNQPTIEPISSQHTASEPSTPQDHDDNILANPKPTNEFVGVDEENLYLHNACKSGFSQPESESEFESDSDYQEEYMKRIMGW
jgi:hypothetical protein